MDIALILTVIFFASAIIGIVWINKDNSRLMQYHIAELQKENKRLHKQIMELLEKEFKETLKKGEAQPQEHELQGEFEADDDTYNKIVSDWIYGADEEEGGLNGE